MPTIWHTATVKSIETLAPEVRSFYLEVQGIELFDFKPGQFITLDLPISDKRQKRWRSYSIASAPNGNMLELCIVRAPDGLGSNWLFENAKVGTELTFKGPDGVFTLPKDTEKTLVMVCTGTGIAPFRSMIQAMAHGLVDTRPVHLIFGTRYAEGILYGEEMDHLCSILPDFRYDVALSREIIPGFYSGYLHQIYQKQYANVQPDVKFMLCGWTNMVDEAVAHLIAEMGYTREQVVYELYG
jgi:ferredoxin-NADP reductase